MHTHHHLYWLFVMLLRHARKQTHTFQQLIYHPSIFLYPFLHVSVGGLFRGESARRAQHQSAIHLIICDKVHSRFDYNRVRDRSLGAPMIEKSIIFRCASGKIIGFGVLPQSLALTAVVAAPAAASGDCPRHRCCCFCSWRLRIWCTWNNNWVEDKK